MGRAARMKTVPGWRSGAASSQLVEADLRNATAPCPPCLLPCPPYVGTRAKLASASRDTPCAAPWQMTTARCWRSTARCGCRPYPLSSSPAATPRLCSAHPGGQTLGGRLWRETSSDGAVKEASAALHATPAPAAMDAPCAAHKYALPVPHACAPQAGRHAHRHPRNLPAAQPGGQGGAHAGVWAVAHGPARCGSLGAATPVCNCSRAGLFHASGRALTGTCQRPSTGSAAACCPDLCCRARLPSAAEYYGAGEIPLRLLAYENSVLSFVAEAERKQYGSQGRRMPLFEKHWLVRVLAGVGARQGPTSCLSRPWDVLGAPCRFDCHSKQVLGACFHVSLTWRPALP